MCKAICIGLDNHGRDGIDSFLYFLGKLEGDAAAERLEEFDDADGTSGKFVGADLGKEMSVGFASRRPAAAM